MKTLGELIVEKQHEFSHATGEFVALLSVIRLDVKIIHRGINKVGLVDILDASGAENVQGEVQQKLSLFVNEKLKAALKVRDIAAGVTSEEEDETVVLEGREHAKYVVLVDPLDGSFSIDVNVSVGTIFSIYHRATPVGTPVTEEDLLQPGNKQVAAGCVVYDSSTTLTYTIRCGVHASTYGPSLGVFCLCQERMCSPEKGGTYSINKGNYIKLSNGMRKYIKFCQEEGKPTDRPYTPRYIGSLVADFHRNLLRDGIYLYPSTASHPDGELRLPYECNPMTFLAGQADDKVSDDKEHVLDIIPETLRQRRSFSVGNDHMAEGVKRFIHEFPDV